MLKCSYDEKTGGIGFIMFIKFRHFGKNLTK